MEKVNDNLPYIKIAADPSTTLPDGTQVKDLDDLKNYLLNNRQDDIAENLVRRMLTYALGRSLEFSDDQTIHDLTQQFKNNDHKFASLMEDVALSDLFQMK